MKSNVSFSDFCDGFGEDHKNNFSYEGKRALYDYLIEYEESTGEEVEFDPIALCCEYSEYESIDELKDEYEIRETDSDEETLEWFRDRTQVIEMDNGGIIIQQF